MNWKVIVRAYNKDGYHKDVLIMDEVQVRMSNVAIRGVLRDGKAGQLIVPADMPEMTEFMVIIEEYPKR